MSLALLLPNDSAFPPPDCICRMKKIHTPISTSMGNQDINILYQGDSVGGLALMLMFFDLKFLMRSGSSGVYMRYFCPLISVALISWPWMVTSFTRFSSTMAKNSEYPKGVSVRFWALNIL